MSEPTWELLGGGGVLGGPIDYVGDWNPATAYTPGQIVRYNGVDYLSVNPSTGQMPPPAAAPVIIQGLIPIERKVLAAAGGLDFQNIPQIFDHLRLIVSSRTEEALQAGQCFMRFNNDSGANYDWQRLYGFGTTVNAAEGQAQQHFFTYWYPGATGSGADRFGLADILIPNYRQVGQRRGFSTFGNSPAQSSFNNYLHLFGGSWRSSAAVNRITLLPQGLGNWSAGSVATLYGIIDSPITVPVPLSYGTSLPVPTYDGQEAILVDSIANPTYQWRFRYNSFSTSPYKWEFVGGAPARASVEAVESVSGSTFIDLATVGPQLVIPRSGVYDAYVSSYIDSSGISGGWALGYSQLKDNGVDTSVIINPLANVYPTVVPYFSESDQARITVVAGHTLKLMYAQILQSGVTGNIKFGRRRLVVTPARVA